MRRGPDHFGERQIKCSNFNSEEKTCLHESNVFCITINLCAFVLHVRGESVTKQPVEDSFGNVLSWNGEIFGGIEVRITLET